MMSVMLTTPDVVNFSLHFKLSKEEFGELLQITDHAKAVTELLRKGDPSRQKIMSKVLNDIWDAIQAVNS